jgi:hypothetical protein
VTIRVLDPGPIPHRQIERYDDSDLETALEREGVDPEHAKYRLVEATLDELEDVRWLADSHPWGRPMIDTLRARGTPPPVVVTPTEKGRGLALLDGLNRAHANWVLGRPTIRAYELLM